MYSNGCASPSGVAVSVRSLAVSASADAAVFADRASAALMRSTEAL
jgi:hypothetical protein